MRKSQSMTQLSRNLHRALELKGMTQADVIRAFPEVSPATVGHWFTGKRQPLVDNLRKLAAILETTVGRLEAEDEDFAQDNQERLTLRLMRSTSPEMREAVLALLQADKLKSTK